MPVLFAFRFSPFRSLFAVLKHACPFRFLASILDRLGTSAEVWGQRIQRLLAKSRLLGSYFSADRERLRQLARQRGVHHLDNLAAGPA